MKQHAAVHSKRCQQCKNKYEVLYDSYTDTCPSCSVETPGVLRQTEGGWIWKEA